MQLLTQSGKHLSSKFNVLHTAVDYINILSAKSNALMLWTD